MPGTAKRQSLKDYAKERGARRGGLSWMEQLPPDVLEECKAGWRDGLRHAAIVNWLIDVGYPDATQGRVAWLEGNHE